MRRALLCLLALSAAAVPGMAHDGPPYPILVDEPFGTHTVSVWADPDVGVGTFYIYLPDEEAGGPGDDTIIAWVQPADGRLPEARHVAVPANSSQPYQRVIKAEFDARGLWKVRFTVESPPGAPQAAGETATELATEINVTPPGLGQIDVLWFMAPFLLVAFLWAKAVLRRRAYARSVQEGA